MFVLAETVVSRCFWVDFWQEQPKSSLHFWLVMKRKMMHQICYSFLKYLEIVEIEPKYCFFGSFYTLRDTPQDIKFHPYRISLKTKISAKPASIGIINNIYSRSQKNHRSLRKLSGKSFFEPKLGLLCHNGSKSYSQILT